MVTNKRDAKIYDVIFNPKGIESAYLEGLNICFGDWGGRDMWEWCFKRQIGDLKTDIMVFKKDGKIIAGSAVTYRKVLFVNNSMINVGIITGSWTLPHARRQGCFTRMIKESLTLVSGKGATYLLGVGAQRNASFRPLSEASFSLPSTYYLFSDNNTTMPESDFVIFPVSDVRKGLETIFERLKKSQTGFLHFTYSFREWQSQFWARPGKIELLCINDIALVIIEKKGDSDRILVLSLDKGIAFGDCIKALLKRALCKGRKLFLFTTSKSWRDESIKLGLKSSPGCIYTLVANENESIKAYPRVSNSAKDIGNKFYGTSNHLYIDSWDMQSGDRM